MAPLGLAEFHVSPGLVGLLAAGEPLGALMGGALIAAGVLRMDHRLLFAGGSSLFMVMLLVVALSQSYWLALAVLIIGGFGTAGFPHLLDDPPIGPRCPPADRMLRGFNSRRLHERSEASGLPAATGTPARHWR